ncbi:hypothetical protein ABK040_002251 [Willaertia magna]
MFETILYFTLRFLLIFIFSIYNFFNFFISFILPPNLENKLKISNEAKVWNNLVKFTSSFDKNVKTMRESRSLQNNLYPKMELLTEKIEKISELNHSLWITTTLQQDNNNLNNNLNGIECKSFIKALNSFQQKKENDKCQNNIYKVSHILSVEYKLLIDKEIEKIETDLEKELFTTTIDDALEDCFNCFKWLIEKKQVKAKDIIIVGSSAGGNLTLNLILQKLLNNLQLNKDLQNNDLQNNLQNNNLEQQLNNDLNKYWPVHGVVLLSSLMDTFSGFIEPSFLEENIILLPKKRMNLFKKCISEKDRQKYSILKTLQKLNFCKCILNEQTKWIINFSNHEELTRENLIFIENLKEMSERSGLSKEQFEKRVKIVTENYQHHCYTIAYDFIEEAKKSMNEIFHYLLLSKP